MRQLQFLTLAVSSFICNLSIVYGLIQNKLFCIFFALTTTQIYTTNYLALSHNTLRSIMIQYIEIHYDPYSRLGKKVIRQIDKLSNLLY